MAPAGVVTWTGAERESGERTRLPYLEVGESGLPLLDANVRANETTAALGTLAAGVAHEINDPLTHLLIDVDRVLQGLRRLAATPPPRDEVLQDEIASNIQSLARVMEGARRIQKIVRDLTTFSQDDVTHPSLVDVRGILESALEIASHAIRPRARLTRSLAEVPPVAANEAHLAQVFLSLLVHAPQAIREGHADENEVLVSTRVEGERLLVEIADTGAGIATAELGLSVAYGFVRAMGGDLSARSKVGRGTTFRVSLSAARPYPVARGRGEEVGEPWKRSARSSRRRAPSSTQ